MYNWNSRKRQFLNFETFSCRTIASTIDGDQWSFYPNWAIPTKVSPTSLLHIFYFDAKHGNKESKNKESSVSGIWFLFIVFSLFFARQVSEKRSCSHVVQLLRLRFVWCYLKFSCHCLISSHLHDYYSHSMRVNGIRLKETYNLKSSPKPCVVLQTLFFQFMSFLENSRSPMKQILQANETTHLPISL